MHEHQSLATEFYAGREPPPAMPPSVVVSKTGTLAHAEDVDEKGVPWRKTVRLCRDVKRREGTSEATQAPDSHLVPLEGARGSNRLQVSENAATCRVGSRAGRRRLSGDVRVDIEVQSIVREVIMEVAHSTRSGDAEVIPEEGCVRGGFL